MNFHLIYFPKSREGVTVPARLPPKWPAREANPMPRARTVPDPAPPIIPGERPTPPPELSPEQQAIWTSIVGRLAAGLVHRRESCAVERAVSARLFCRHARRRDRASAGLAR